MEAPSKKSLSNLTPKLITGGMLGVIVIVCFLFLADFQKVMHTLLHMPVHWLLLAFLLTFMSYLLRLWKWQAFCRWSHFSIRLKDNAAVFFIGLMMSITPGKAGEVIKSYMLHKKADVPYTASLPVILYDRLTDLLAMMVLIGIGLLVYPFGIWSLLVLVLVLVTFFLLIQWKLLIEKLIYRITGPKKLRRFRTSMMQLYEHTLYLLQFRFLSFSFVVSFIAWLLECISLYMIFQALAIDVSFIAAILTFSLGTVAGALSMIPGGLGAAEGSISGMLVYFGVSGSLAVTTSLIIRFVTLWFGVILGLIVFIVKRKDLFSK